MSWLRRRARIGAVVALACCLVVTGCTSGAEPEGAPSPTAPTSTSASPDGPVEPVTLRLAVHGEAALREAFDKMATSFTNTHPQVDVVVERSSSAERAAEKLQQQVAAGDAPDVFVASSERVPGLAAADQVQPVDQMLEERGVEFGDSYQRLGLEAFSAEQALQCMPYDVSPMVVFYHPGLVPFRRLIGPGEEPLTPESGWTWDQFAQAARIISGEGVKGAYVAPELSTLTALVRSAGDDIVDDPREATTLTLADDGTRAALEEILAVVRDKRITPTPEQLSRRDAFHRFTHEQVAMLIGTRAMVPRLREVEELDFDVFPLPHLARSETVAEVDGLCLSADTEHAGAAADLIAFASRDRGAAILAESGAVVPSHLPTLNSVSFTQPGSQPESVLVFGDVVRRATTSPFVIGWPVLEQAMAPEFESMFYDPLIDLDAMLPRLDLESQQIIAPVPEP